MGGPAAEADGFAELRPAALLQHAPEQQPSLAALQRGQNPPEQSPPFRSPRCAVAIGGAWIAQLLLEAARLAIAVAERLIEAAQLEGPLQFLSGAPLGGAAAQGLHQLLFAQQRLLFQQAVGAGAQFAQASAAAQRLTSIAQVLAHRTHHPGHGGGAQAGPAIGIKRFNGTDQSEACHLAEVFEAVAGALTFAPGRLPGQWQVGVHHGIAALDGAFGGVGGQQSGVALLPGGAGLGGVHRLTGNSVFSPSTDWLGRCLTHDGEPPLPQLGEGCEAVAPRFSREGSAPAAAGDPPTPAGPASAERARTPGGAPRR